MQSIVLWKGEIGELRESGREEEWILADRFEWEPAQELGDPPAGIVLVLGTAVDIHDHHEHDSFGQHDQRNKPWNPMVVVVVNTAGGNSTLSRTNQNQNLGITSTSIHTTPSYILYSARTNQNQNLVHDLWL